MNSTGIDGTRIPFSFRTVSALFSAVLTLSAFAMSVNAIPPLVTSIAGDFNFPIGIFGYLFSLQFLIFMIASFAGGALLEKTGIKPGLLVAFGLTGLSASFFMMPFLSTFSGLLLWIVLLGFSGGLVETFASVIVSSYDSPGSGRLLNLSQVFYCIGAISAPQIVASFLDRMVPWKSIFLLFGLLEIVLALFFILLSFHDIRGHTDVVSVDKKLIGSGSQPLFRNPVFVFLSLSILVYVLSESFLVFWLPAYLEVHYSFSPAASARGVSYYWTGLIIGRTGAMFFPGRVSLWKIIMVSSIGMFGCAIALSFPLNPNFLTLLIILIGIFSGPIWASIVSIGKQAGRTPRFIPGIIGAGSLGASLGPLLSGAVLRTGGFGLYFPVLSSGILLLIFLILISKKTSKKIGV